jgi:cyclopropane fatty-acyl-phospholipid synthase-like methyltransferase
LTALPQSPAAERNKDPILAVLRDLLPGQGIVLEVASGSGQHVVHFAAAMPALTWQPSDADAAQRAVIEARAAESRLPNVLTPFALDVHDSRWLNGSVGGPFDALICINMIHVAPWSATAALFRGARAHLNPRAPLLLYGPFGEEGRHTAPSNERFDRSLRSENAAWGVRDLRDVESAAQNAGFVRAGLVRMPANNLSVVFRMEK